MREYSDLTISTEIVVIIKHEILLKYSPLLRYPQWHRQNHHGYLGSALYNTEMPVNDVLNLNFTISAVSFPLPDIYKSVCVPSNAFGS
jgi:hypothetical protein